MVDSPEEFDILSPEQKKKSIDIIIAFRPAFFTIGIQTKRLVEGPHITIPIPFVKLDKFIILRIGQEK